MKALGIAVIACLTVVMINAQAQCPAMSGNLEDAQRDASCATKKAACGASEAKPDSKVCTPTSAPKCRTASKACSPAEVAKCKSEGKVCGPRADKSCKPERKKGCKSACKSPKVEHAEITTSALNALLNAKTPLVLLDARSGKYDDGQRIPGAISLHSRSSAEEVAQVIPDKGTLIVTYCSSLKCPASAKLAERLRALGYENVIEYPEGIKGWVGTGHPVVTAPPKS